MYSDLAYLFSAVIHFAIAETQMLQALYDKIYLPKCAENWMEMNFEYLNISLDQKLIRDIFLLI